MKNVKQSSGRIVPVVVPVAVDRAYSYRVTNDLAVETGSIVRVPLGTREVIGAVWDGEVDNNVESVKIKDIIHVYSTPLLSSEIRGFVDWVANWTLTSPGMILRMILRVPGALEPEKPVQGLRFVGHVPEKLTSARKRILELVDNGLPWLKSDLANEAGVSQSVVVGLIKSGTLEYIDMPETQALGVPDFNVKGVKLSPEQSSISSQLIKECSKGFSVSLLEGVTGSGKTEVYFEVIAEVMKSGKQVLILVPEISLTAQFLARFEKRFKVKPAEWHSEVSKKNREKVWRNVAANKISVVVGARSALFLPFMNLGLIVIDEEHDGSFKQVDRVSYNARDMSVVKGRLGNFPVVLSSATPSIESRVNANSGRYRRFEMKKRVSGTQMPDIETIDMREQGPEKGNWLAPRLVDSITEAIRAKNQSLLFLNRRGYAPLTLCRTCGYRFHCNNCSTWLIEHRFRNVILCHHCGYSEKKPEKCPQCDSDDSLVACGPGVERVSEEVATRFPEARTLILSSDLGGGIERLKRELQMIEEFQVDIVVGTQIVAKGMNFPSLMLVGVVDADLGLSYGDLRAAEKTYQLLAQVTGRAGRFHGRGRGILQTYAPEHPVIKAMVSGDSESFYTTEIAMREQAGMPPFGRLAAIIVSAPDKASAEQFSRTVARKAPPSKDATVLGPVEAPLALIRGRHRYRLLVQVSKNFDLQAYFRRWLPLLPPQRGGLKMQVDVDPYSFM